MARQILFRPSVLLQLMLRQTCRRVRAPKASSSRLNGLKKARIHTGHSSQSDSKTLDFKLPLAALGGSVTAAALAFSYAHVKPILNEATPDVSRDENKPLDSAPVVWDDEHLLSLAWGSNKGNILSPAQSENDVFRVPSGVPWLKDVALRDLALHERYGVCVDARGDVYQWDERSKGPVLALAGKDIVSVQASPSRPFTLSSSGKIYALSSESQTSTHEDKSSSYWNPFSWGSNAANKGYIELIADQKLSRGERFVSISAGNEHLLALTSSGRTFAHPISKNANTYGQMGLRKFSLSAISGSASAERRTIDLIPKAVADPYANVSRTQRGLPIAEDSLEETTVPEAEKTDGVFCDRLYEIPSLKGIKIAQAVASARSSFVRTEAEGRVLAWGANEHGQLGLGSTSTIDTITIPTEVIFSRTAPLGTRSRCIDINTGGDLVFFTIERTDGSFMPSIDVLSCGMGQWGGLGNGIYTTAQGDPSRVRAVSGILEFSEKTQNLQPLVPYAMSVSPTGHVLLTLDTLARAGPGVPAGGGRDLLVWGANRQYQLGNGKRTSLATPALLELSGLPGGGGPEAGKKENGTGVEKKGRLMLVQRRAKEVKDLQGRRWKTNVDVEQSAVAGFGSSLIYWKIVRK